MCGRYTVTSPLDELLETFDVSEVVLGAWRPRYNVAPGQEAPALVAGKNGLRLGLLTWGGEGPSGRSRINVRSENLGRVPSYREAMKARRCLIPADGFYEWKADSTPADDFGPDLFSASGNGGTSPRGRPPRPRGRRTPYWFHRPDRGLFGLAGLWEPSTAEGSPPSFVILTTEPNARVAQVHDRMPVVLTPEEGRRWLDRGEDPKALRELLAPAAEDFLEAWPVAPAVGSSDFDDPSCVLPAGPPLVRPRG